MRTLVIRSLLVILLSGCGGAPSPPAVADDRDRQVMEALLLHLLASSEFDLTRIGTTAATIVLDTRTPGGNRTLQPDQMWHPAHIGMDHIVPEDVQRDVVRRNGKLPGSFTELKFDPRITLTTLHSSYELVSPGIAQSDTNSVFLRCRVHGHMSYTDATVFDGTRRRHKFD